MLASVQPNITLAIEKKQIAENGISFFSIIISSFRSFLLERRTYSTSSFKILLLQMRFW